MSSMTIDLVIAVLQSAFAAYGLPEQIVLDKGPQFASQACADFLHSNDITHTQTATLHQTGQWKDLSKLSSRQ